MAKCIITGKSWMNGKKVSNSNKKTKRKYKANIHKKKIYNEKTKKFQTIKISAKGLKYIDKLGFLKFSNKI